MRQPKPSPCSNIGVESMRPDITLKQPTCEEAAVAAQDWAVAAPGVGCAACHCICEGADLAVQHGCIDKQGMPCHAMPRQMRYLFRAILYQDDGCQLSGL